MNEELKNYELAKAQTVLRMFSEYFRLDLKAKRVLEIGCSTGVLMRLLEQHGAEAHGVDVQTHWSQNYDYKEDRRIMCDLQEQDISEDIGSFDLVVAQEVIEHIERPYDFLPRVWALLKPGGLLLLTTPNLTGITAGLKGKHWCGLTTEGHLLLYSPKSLDFLLSNCGFERIRTVTNLVPIVHQAKRPWLWWVNRPFISTSFGGGLVSLYRKTQDTNK